ncbi:hypothetical protein BaRGS_00014989 [Batillaria attramentaria]|uniref:Ankyrin repeat protein n=1 Tax=Batillaria attramentaria TaxID=370345 RepID=A0ABD0L3P2_9CAEN
MAASLADFVALDALLKSRHHIKVDVPDFRGWTALSYAARALAPDLVKTLLNAGANVNHLSISTIKEEDGSPLHLALHVCPFAYFQCHWCGSYFLLTASERPLQTVLALLDSSAGLVDQRDSLGRTALMMACKHDHEAAVIELLEKGADPDLEDHEGRTALWWACAGCCQNPPRALSTILLTRVPRRVLSIPWDDPRSPLAITTTVMDDTVHQILFCAGVSNYKELTRLRQRLVQEERIDEEEAATIKKTRVALEQCLSRPRMLQDICLLTVVRSLCHLTKPSERNDAFESLELNPGVWKRMVGMGIAFCAKPWRKFVMALPPPDEEDLFHTFSPCSEDGQSSGSSSPPPDEEQLSDDLCLYTYEEQGSDVPCLSANEEHVSDEEQVLDDPCLSTNEEQELDVPCLSTYEDEVLDYHVPLYKRRGSFM